MEKFIETFDLLKLNTKIIFLLVFIIIVLLAWNVLKFLSNSFKAKEFLSFFKKMIKIIAPLETGTIAGIINLILTVVFALLTIAVFLSSTLANILGFSDGINSNQILLIITTIFVGFISSWALLRYDKEMRVLNK